MRNSIFRSAALSLGILLAGVSIAPAGAMPVPNPSVNTSSDVQVVRDNKAKIWRHRGRVHKNFHGARKNTWRGHRSHHVNHWRGRGHHYRNGYHYWNGHRGYHYYRPGYRYYGGWWYPAAAFSVGVVVGSHPHASRHVRWCYNHYRSYRASDNTFQPNNGPRKACISPYSR